MPSLSQDQVRLVLRRAAELEKRQDATPGTVGETDVAEIAEEVGIAPDAVRTALAELRAGAIPGEAIAERTLLDKMVGPAEVVCTRTVRGPVAQVQLEIDRFMRGQLLEIKRNLGPRGQLWAPAGDLWSKLKRAFDIGQQVGFEKGAEVAVNVVPTSDEQVLVRMTVRMSEPRKERAWGIAAGTAAGAALAGIGIAVFHTAPLEIASVAAGASAAVGTFFGVRHKHRQDLSLAEQVVLRFLDRLEYER